MMSYQGQLKFMLEKIQANGPGIKEAQLPKYHSKCLLAAYAKPNISLAWALYEADWLTWQVFREFLGS